MNKPNKGANGNTSRGHIYEPATFLTRFVTDRGLTGGEWGHPERTDAKTEQLS